MHFKRQEKTKHFCFQFLYLLIISRQTWRESVKKPFTVLFYFSEAQQSCLPFFHTSHISRSHTHTHTPSVQPLCFRAAIDKFVFLNKCIMVHKSVEFLFCGWLAAALLTGERKRTHTNIHTTRIHWQTGRTYKTLADVLMETELSHVACVPHSRFYSLTQKKKSMPFYC